MANRLLQLESELLRERKVKTRRKPARSRTTERASSQQGLGRYLYRSPRRVRPRALNLPVNYRVPGIVPLLAQPTARSCWATVFTMLYSWKEGQSISIEHVLEQIGGRWLDAFRADTGLSSSDKVDFVAAAGLIAEPPMNLTIEGWEQMLRDYGPIWVTTDEAPGKPWAIHARVITGIQGDGTPDNTYLTIVDPHGGRQYRESVATFIPKYEEEIVRTGHTRIQILHWPRDARFGTAKALAARYAPQAMANIVDYAVPGVVPTLAQPTGWSCWATVYTMLLSWKREQSLSIEDALSELGNRWLGVFKADKGLAAEDTADFIRDAGLVSESPMNFSIAGWEQLLRNCGPIWVTTDEAPGKPWAIHARVITGIRGDGSPAGTHFNVVDPASGRQYQESIATFVPKYEEEVRRTGYTRIQIVHWPSGARVPL